MRVFAETKGEGEPLVLLHGGCDDHRYMLPIMELLHDHYQVTILDEPGRGKSNWQPQIQNIYDMADSLIPVLPKRAIYISWSFGGLIALALAAQYPEKVVRIINICSSPKFIESDNWPGIPAPGFSPLINKIKEEGLSSFLTALHDEEFKSFMSKPEAYERVNSYIPNDADVDMNAIEKRIQMVDKTDLRQEFSSLKCPIDLILGGKDEAVPSELYPMLTQLNPKAKLHVIQEGKHMPFWTHPEEFNIIIKKILLL